MQKLFAMTPVTFVWYHNVWWKLSYKKIHKMRILKILFVTINLYQTKQGHNLLLQCWALKPFEIAF
jgi:hypothetical protein